MKDSEMMRLQYETFWTSIKSFVQKVNIEDVLNTSFVLIPMNWVEYNLGILFIFFIQKCYMRR